MTLANGMTSVDAAASLLRVWKSSLERLGYTFDWFDADAEISAWWRWIEHFFHLAEQDGRSSDVAELVNEAYQQYAVSRPLPVDHALHEWRYRPAFEAAVRHFALLVLEAEKEDIQEYEGLWDKWIDKRKGPSNGLPDAEGGSG